MPKFSVTFTYTETGSATATIEADDLAHAKEIAEHMDRDDERITESPCDGEIAVEDIEEQP
jgi:hypothetical protein